MLELNKPYNRTEFLNFLERTFLPDDFVVVEENLTISDFKTSFCNSAVKLGSSKTLGLDVYEVTHTSSHDARVGISKDAFQILLRKSYNNRALVLFVPEGSRQYRFSLIQIEAEVNDQTARIKRSYSNPRRYSFLLGENAHVKTPEQYLLQKGKLKPKDGDYFKDLQERFSVEVLTKEFYRELSNWYFWAVKKVTFPNDINDESDNEKYNTENIIRLITRLVFVWFIKQKALVSPDLFNPEVLKTILKDFEPESPVQHQYYRAILQNLFFATLNQEVGKRGFAENKGFHKNRVSYNIKNLYRYENEFQCDTSKVLQLFSEVPFLNGGLFECLDDKVKDGKTFYWDGFSRITTRQAIVPNELFFAKETIVDISKEYNDKKMQSVKVSGIIEILNKYNFTVEENTPVEIEVALDPELLGKVFENLLGAYNPETQETARKQTGSFYTPREIVNYMVNESLIAYYQTKVPEVNEDNLRALFSYEDKTFDIPDSKREALIQATFDCKILDPACGSGAFPMGILQQMVHVLGKLDPQNTHWSRLVLEKSMQEFDEAENESDEDKLVLQEEIYNTFDTHFQFPDYTRKLYLIENCIYGVDIQSIAVQISKLRFFISLICEQKRNRNPEMNYGIRPLPNLETKFVAANTLIGIEKPEEDVQYLKEDQINHMIKRLNHLRHRQFSVTNAQKKKELRKKDEALRHEIVNEVARLYKLHADENLNRYKMQLKLAEKELEFLERAPDDIRTTTSSDLFGNEKTESFNFTEKRRKELRQQIKMLNNNIEAGSNYSRLNSVVRLAEQLTSWNPYDQNNHSEFFDPEWMFGLKPDEDGGGYFDVVIGNPPYVEAKKLKEIASKLKSYNVSTGTSDLSVYFIEAGINNCKENGNICFITTNKFFNTGYGKPVRKFIIEYQIDRIIDFEQVEVFENVLVSSVVIGIKKQKLRKPQFSYQKFYKLNKEDFKSHFVSKQMQFGLYNQALLSQNEWSFSDNIGLALKQKIESAGTKISNLKGVAVYRGVTTGYNPAFIIDTKIKNQLISADIKNKEIIKPLLQGRNIKKWLYNYNNDYLIFTKQGIKIDEYPVIKEYLNDFYKELKPREFEDEKNGRKPGSYQWYEIQDNTAYFKEFEKTEKIIWGLTADKWAFAFDDKKHYLPSNGYILTSEKISIKYLIALLNSKVLKYYFGFIGVMTAGGALTLKHSTIQQLPIVISKNQQEIISIVSKILSTDDSKNESLDRNFLEQQLDLLVYRLYDLTYSEVKVIDPEIEGKISEEEYAKIELE